MDELRMNMLFKHVENMDSKLISKIEKYKKYSEYTIPCVAVLCSDNKLRSEVDRVFSIREDVVVDSFVTSEYISEEKKYEAMLSDAVVICTRAKNIAPKGLYDLVKCLSEFDKQCFVILAGWDSIGRTPEMVKKRTERVAIEFDFARIMEVMNVFSSTSNVFLVNGKP